VAEPTPSLPRRSWDYRIVQERHGKTVVVWLSPDGDEEHAFASLAQYRALAPADVQTHLEEQDITPRPWNRRDA
jgi:hypothetical protein